MGTVNLALSERPDGDVRIDLSSDQSAIADVDWGLGDAFLTFTVNNWDQAQGVSIVAGVDDSTLQDLSTLLTVSASNGGYDTISDQVTVNVTNTTAPGMTVSETSFVIDEGGQDSFMVVLDAQPTDAVTLTLVSDDPAAVLVSPTSLSFTTANWDVAQTVTVEGVQDGDTFDEADVEISVSAADGGYDGLSATLELDVIDHDYVSPDAPTGLSAEPIGGKYAQLYLNWTEPGYDGGDAIIEYRIQLDTGDAVRTVDTGSSATETIVSINSSDSYSVSVAAANTAGAGTYSTPVSVPSVSLSSAAAQHVSEGFEVTATFSDAVTGFDSSDVTVGNGIVSSWVTGSDGDTTYVFEVTPTSDGTVSVDVEANVVGNMESNQLIRTYDSTAPTFSDDGDGDDSRTSFTVAENVFAVGTLVASDSTGSSVTYAISGGVDGEDFVIDPDTGALRFDIGANGDAADYEAPADDDGNNEYILEVSVSDEAVPDANIATQTVIVTVTNVLENAALSISTDSLTIVEGQVGTLNVALSERPDGDVRVDLSSDQSAIADVDWGLGNAFLTFTVNNWDQAQGVSIVAGVDDSTLQDLSAVLTVSASSGGYDGTSDQVTVNVTNATAPSVTASTTSIELDEGGQDSFTLVLDAQPTDAVTLTLASDDPAAVGVSPTTLSFTTSNWDVAQTATVEGVQDSDTFDKVDIQISMSLAGGGYDSLSATLEVDVIDDDYVVPDAPTGLFVEPLDGQLSLNWTEPAYDGGDAIVGYRVQLDDGTSVWTVDTGSVATQATVAIDNGKAYTVSVSAVNAAGVGAYSDPAYVPSVTLSAGVGAYVSQSFEVTATFSGAVTGFDSSGVTVDNGTVSSWGSGSDGDATYVFEVTPTSDGTVSVDVEPNVVGNTAAIQLTRIYDTTAPTFSDDGDGDDSRTTFTVAENVLAVGTLGVTDASGAALSFAISGGVDGEDFAIDPDTGALRFDIGANGDAADYEAPADDDGNNEYILEISVSDEAEPDANIATQTVIVTVTNVLENAALSVSTDTLTIAEGQVGTLNIALSERPDGDVRVDLSSDQSALADIDWGLADAFLTFTVNNWDQAQGVSIVAGVDDSTLQDLSAVLTVSASSGGYDGTSDQVTVNVTNATAPSVTASTTLIELDEGGQDSFTLVLDVQPTDAVTLTLASDDPAAVGISPTTLSFTTSNWNVAQTVTVDALQDDDTFDGFNIEVSVSAADGGYDGLSATLELDVTDDDYVVPDAPTGLSVEPLDSQLSLSWTEPAYDGGDAISGYRVQLYDGTSVGTVYTGSVATQAIVDIDNGKAYTVSVAAVNAAGVGPYSDSAYVASVSLSSSAAQYVSEGFEVTATFSVGVTGFDSSGVTVDNGTVSSWVSGSDGDTTYVFVVTPTSEGTVSIDVEPNVVQNTAAIQLTRTYDTTAPTFSDDGDGDHSRTSFTVAENVFDVGTLGASDSTGSSVTYAISGGVDGDDFVIDPDTGALRFSIGTNGEAADYEAPADDDGNNEYILEVSVFDEADPNPNVSTQTVIVTVTNVLENAALSVSTDTLTIVEGQVGTVNVALSERPDGDVRVDLSSDQSAIADVDWGLGDAFLTFTVNNWDQAQGVSLVAGVDDSTLQDLSALLTVSASDGGYDGTSDQVTVNVTNATAASVTVSATSFELDEGEQDSFTLVLDAQPTDAVMLTLASDDPGAVGISPTTLNFTTGNWNMAQTVTVETLQSGDTFYEAAVEISVSAAGGGYDGLSQSLEVDVIDDGYVAPDAPTGLSVEPLDGQLNLSWTEPAYDGGDAIVGYRVQLYDGTTVWTVYTGSVATQATVDIDNGKAYTVSVAALNAAGAGAYSDSAYALSVTLSADVGTYVSEAFEVTATFSAAVTGFDSSDVTVGNGTVSSWVSGSDGDRTYVFVVTPTSDGTVSVDVEPNVVGNTAAIQLTRIYDTTAPTFSDDGDGDDRRTSFTVTENVFDVGTLGVTDASGAALSFAIIGGVDGEDFVIDPDTGALRFSIGANGEAADYEAPADDDGNNEYSLEVSVSDEAEPNLNVSTQTVIVTVTNVLENAALSVSTDALTIVEGQVGTLNLALSERPDGDVRVELSSNQLAVADVDWGLGDAFLTFTVNNWDQEQGVSIVAGVDDSTLQDLSALLTVSASNGGYDGTSDQVTVNVTNATAPSVTVSATSFELDEGGQDSFTLVLDAQPTDAVTLTLASDDPGAVGVSPTTLNFTTGNWNMVQTVTVETLQNGDSFYEADVEISVSAAGGGYDGLSATLDVDVIDDDYVAPDAPTGLSVEPLDSQLSLSWTEPAYDGGAAIVGYRIQLYDGTDVWTVYTGSVATQATVDIDNGKAYTVSVAALNAAGAGDYSDSAYAPSVTLSAYVGTYVNQTFEVTATFSAAVTGFDSSGVTVGNGTVSSWVSGSDGDRTYVFAVTPTSDGTVSVDVEPNVVGNTAAIQLMRTYDTTGPTFDDDGDGDDSRTSFTVAENVFAVGTLVASDSAGSSVTYAISGGVDGDDFVIDPDTGALSFSIGANGAAADYEAPADNDGNNEYSLEVSASGQANPNLGVSTQAVIVTVTNVLENAGLSISTDSLTIAEGQVGTLNLALSERPYGDVRVELSSDQSAIADVDWGLGDAFLTFTVNNWDQAQGVSIVAGVDDSILQDLNTLLTASASNGGYDGISDQVTVNVTNTTVPGLTVSATSLEIDEGGQDSFTIRLNTAPNADVRAEIASAHDDMVWIDWGEDREFLTFTSSNWDIPKDVIFRAAENDTYGKNSSQLNVSLTSQDMTYANLSDQIIPVSITDNEILALIVDSEQLSLELGEQTTFSVLLAGQPSDDVNVNVHSANPEILSLAKEGIESFSGEPTNLIFGQDNWNEPQQVMVQALESDVGSANQLIVNLFASGAEYEGVEETVNVTIQSIGTQNAKEDAGALASSVATSEVISDQFGDVIGDAVRGGLNARSLNGFAYSDAYDPDFDAYDRLYVISAREGQGASDVFTLVDWFSFGISQASVDAELSGDGNLVYALFGNEITKTEQGVSGMLYGAEASSWDYADETDVDRAGFSIGYYRAQRHKDLTFSGSAIFTRSHNDFTNNAGATGSAGSNRLILKGEISGKQLIGNKGASLKPYVDLMYATEDLESFVFSDGTQVADTHTDVGRLGMGLEYSRPINNFGQRFLVRGELSQVFGADDIILSDGTVYSPNEDPVGSVTFGWSGKPTADSNARVEITIGELGNKEKQEVRIDGQVDRVF